MPNPPNSGLPNAQSYSAASASTVIDNVTCLEWQRDPAPSTYTQEQAIAYCGQLVLEGHDDWRLPTRIELVTLVRITLAKPAIDSTAFPQTPSEVFWSSSLMKRITGSGWWVNFDDGGTVHESATLAHHARCVRSAGSPPLVSRYIVGNGSAAGTVYDQATKLTWERVGSQDVLWADAKARCAGLVLDGAGWRLPTITELQSIVDESRTNPAIDATAFPATRSAGFWTSDPWAQAPGSYVWRVDFFDGISNGGAPIADWKDNVRCVR
jgi:hypothetical protein